MKKSGFVHIYYGDGKGKTTAGMGLILRAAGYGHKVLVYQFMKDNDSSERVILGGIPNIQVVPGRKQEKFSFQLNEEERQERKQFYEEIFEELIRKAEQEKYQVLFLDEIIYTIRAGLFDEERLTRYLNNKPEDLEVILTGNDPGETLLRAADYVSEIVKKKHPYDAGVPARFGIEK